ncbi:TauD/TfdA family dioxygenase [Streptomyces sp. NPDC058622]|uniref:TauD/TfdA family dioxygenase n=1 Tax=Streptomyces sp. NPDC058622 TaxID=3346562 RepID=UPI003659B9AE
MPSPAPSPSPDGRPRPGLPPLLYADAPAGAAGWVAGNRDALRAAVAGHGAVLVRGLGIREPGQVGEILDGFGAPPVGDTEAFAPRRTYANGVYSSSPWPSNQPMCMHHELSYTLAFPSVMMFACLGAPTAGGATAVADSADVFDALPPAVTERFVREGWLLARSYGNDIGASTAEAFGTDDPRAIERYCRANAIDLSWQPDGTLHTRQRRSAVLRHPVTGRRCWFNQIAFLNEWTIDPEVHDYLIAEYGADGLPFNTFHGNGDPVSPETVHLIDTAYKAHAAGRPWQEGDLLILDNLRTAHSREAFQGPRDVVVAMGGPLHPNDCSPTIEVTRP